ncbi:hypothetical protein SAMN06296020_101363 [Anoxynatronum buryatiense]|uniref:FeoB-associated Cys-rich membrane protein n=1 Tax=Anoxynatronum buryatiense TaxID=489973 RepID=A0AA46AHJ5_9CLOT|nr:hypothetical protein SAMN06296020_101363 [Anoxynatronum buryatiense]
MDWMATFKILALIILLMVFAITYLKVKSKTVRIDIPHTCGGCEGDCQCHGSSCQCGRT